MRVRGHARLAVAAHGFEQQGSTSSTTHARRRGDQALAGAERRDDDGGAREERSWSITSAAPRRCGARGAPVPRRARPMGGGGIVSRIERCGSAAHPGRVGSLDDNERPDGAARCPSAVLASPRSTCTRRTRRRAAPRLGQLQPEASDGAVLAKRPAAGVRLDRRATCHAVHEAPTRPTWRWPRGSRGRSRRGVSTSRCPGGCPRSSPPARAGGGARGGARAGRRRLLGGAAGLRFPLCRTCARHQEVEPPRRGRRQHRRRRRGRRRGRRRRRRLGAAADCGAGAIPGEGHATRTTPLGRIPDGGVGALGPGTYVGGDFYSTATARSARSRGRRRGGARGGCASATRRAPRGCSSTAAGAARALGWCPARPSATRVRELHGRPRCGRLRRRAPPPTAWRRVHARSAPAGRRAAAAPPAASMRAVGCVELCRWGPRENIDINCRGRRRTAPCVCRRGSSAAPEPAGHNWRRATFLLPLDTTVWAHGPHPVAALTTARAPSRSRAPRHLARARAGPRRDDVGVLFYCGFARERSSGGRRPARDATFKGAALSSSSQAFKPAKLNARVALDNADLRGATFEDASLSASGYYTSVNFRMPPTCGARRSRMRRFTRPTTAQSTSRARRSRGRRRRRRTPSSRACRSGGRRPR